MRPAIRIEGNRRKLPKKLGQLAEGHTKAPHPRVDLEMNVDRAARGDRFECIRFGELIENRREPGCDDIAVSATADPVENENRTVDARFAKLDTLLGKRDPKPVDPLGL